MDPISSKFLSTKQHILSKDILMPFKVSCPSCQTLWDIPQEICCSDCRKSFQVEDFAFSSPDSESSMHRAVRHGQFLTNDMLPHHFRRHGHPLYPPYIMDDIGNGGMFGFPYHRMPDSYDGLSGIGTRALPTSALGNVLPSVQDELL